MTLLPVLEFPDPRLRIKANPVTCFDDNLRRLVTDMYTTMYAAHGVGLAATQVNVSQQVLVMDMSEAHNTPLTLINARIVAKEGSLSYQEGCLSFPGVYAYVSRAMKVEVQAFDVQGNAFVYLAQGPLAVVVQHEIDHLLGRVFVDYLSPLRRNMLLRRLRKQRKARA